MIPSYYEKDRVIVSSISYLFMKPKKGDVVIFERNKKNYIKRIKYVKGNEFFLAGDNEKDSLDSRKFGLINRDQIKGKIIFKLQFHLNQSSDNII